MGKFHSDKLHPFLGSRGFYIALVLCLTLVGIFGYYAIFGEKEPAKDVSNPTPVVEQPAPRPAVQQPEPQQEPKGQPDSPAEVIPDVEALLPQVVSPLDGTTVTVFSMTQLLYDETMGDWRTHNGLDIQADEGAAVKTAAAGTVAQVIDDALMGTTVTITHAGGYTTHYSSLQASPPVAEGDELAAGDIIGYVGTTAAAESVMGPHLHFSVSQDGRVIDPGEYIN